jgi:protein-disulfide isomerase
MSRSSSRRRLVCPLAVIVAVTAIGCGGHDDRAALEEIAKQQKEILAKLDGLEKAVAQVKAAPAAARPQIDPNRVYTIPVGASATKGAADAKVTVVEFADYQCPFCAQAAPLVQQVLDAYPKDVRVVYKQFPLTTIHQNALPAAKAAVAAGKQGKFWEMHEALYQNSRNLSPEKLKELAQQIGLDVARWEKDMASPEVMAQIAQDQADGRNADVTGTPTIFVNGKRLMNRSLDGFKAMIDPVVKG